MTSKAATVMRQHLCQRTVRLQKCWRMTVAALLVMKYLAPTTKQIGLVNLAQSWIAKTFKNASSKIVKIIAGVLNFASAWFLGSICVQPLLWVRGHPRSVQKYGVKKTWLKNTYQAPTSNAWKMHRTYVKNNPMKMQKVYKPKMQHMQNLWKYSDWCFEYKHTSIGKGRWTLN